MNSRFVTSLELSRKLKETGIEQKTENFWEDWVGPKEGSSVEQYNFEVVPELHQDDRDRLCSAYTAGELAELLPRSIRPDTTEVDPTYYYLNIAKEYNCWDVSYHDHWTETVGLSFRHENLTEAMGLMLLKLKEEGEI